jgi:hypothetical protein
MNTEIFDKFIGKKIYVNEKYFEKYIEIINGDIADFTNNNVLETYKNRLFIFLKRIIEFKEIVLNLLEQLESNKKSTMLKMTKEYNYLKSVFENETLSDEEKEKEYKYYSISMPGRLQYLESEINKYETAQSSIELLDEIFNSFKNGAKEYNNFLYSNLIDNANVIFKLDNNANLTLLSGAFLKIAASSNNIKDFEKEIKKIKNANLKLINNPIALLKINGQNESNTNFRVVNDKIYIYISVYSLLKLLYAVKEKNINPSITEHYSFADSSSLQQFVNKYFIDNKGEILSIEAIYKAKSRINDTIKKDPEAILDKYNMSELDVIVDAVNSVMNRNPDI